MTKYLDDSPFNSPANSEKYRDNYDRTFGPVTCAACGKKTTRKDLQAWGTIEVDGIQVCARCSSPLDDENKP